MSDKVAEIPQDVKDKIEAKANEEFRYGSQLDPRHFTAIKFAEFGYSLAQQEIERLKGEIQALKHNFRFG